MKTLALETSGFTGSVAAMEHDRVVKELPLPTTSRSAQSLAPAIDAILRELSWRPSDLNLIAVATGPGSFTGLRVGVVTAKTLAYAIGADIVAVNTLEVIAAQAPFAKNPLKIVLDAGRRQFYAGMFRVEQSGKTTWAGETQLVDYDDWLATLANEDCVSGPGLTKIKTSIPPAVAIIQEKHWMPTATSVGRIGVIRHQAGYKEDLWKLEPFYLRKSAAEEMQVLKKAGS